MKIILVAGMEQAGSTLVFNLVQKLYRSYGNYNVDSCWITDFHKKDYNDKCDFLVIKTHGLDRTAITNAYKIILPIRDVRDAAISAYNRGMISKERDIDLIINRMEKNINTLNNWIKSIKQRKLAAFEFMYERYKKNEAGYTEILLNYLEIKLDKEKIKESIEEINKLYLSKDIVKKDDFSYKNIQYKKTLITQNHNTSGGQSKKYETFFSKEENDKIINREKINIFLKMYGYIY